MSIPFGWEYPAELDRWQIVLKTGWTLEQVDALKEKDWREFWAVRDGLIKAGAWNRV